MGYKVECSDIIEFCNNYKGELFHALLCDAPYHLTTITKRFSGESSAPAKFGTDGLFQRVSKGFMGQTWDGGDIAFRKETWEAIAKLLYPGAFGMVFGGSRTFHRMACAIEDAGMIIHPTISWNFSSGFPKATRIDTQIDKASGAERKLIGKDQYANRGAGINGRTFKMENSESDKRGNIYEPGTSLSKAFEGHRYGLQALKPAAEFIIVFQKPYEGRPINNIIETGAGALNIDAGRIGCQEVKTHGVRNGNGNVLGLKNYVSPDDFTSNEIHNGRWPANVVLTHHSDCRIIGRKKVEGYSINRWKDNAHPFGNGAGNEYETEEIEGGYEDVYECVDGCSIKALNEQSGILKSGEPGIMRKCSNDGPVYHEESRKPGTQMTGFGDERGASRFFFNSDYALERLENEDPFFYCGKVSKEERDAGCEEMMGTKKMQLKKSLSQEDINYVKSEFIRLGIRFEE